MVAGEENAGAVQREDGVVCAMAGRHRGGQRPAVACHRLAVADRPGAAAAIATRMAEANISLESIVQRRSEAAAARDPGGRWIRDFPLARGRFAGWRACPGRLRVLWRRAPRSNGASQ